ncbi:hypothetical protein ES703_82685 [subsurface metagenome]
MAKDEMQCFRCDYIFWVDEEDIEKKRKCPICRSEHNVFRRSELQELLDTSEEDKSKTEQDDKNRETVAMLIGFVIFSAIVFGLVVYARIFQRFSVPVAYAMLIGVFLLVFFIFGLLGLPSDRSRKRKHLK